jgi:uncharacterized protein
MNKTSELHSELIAKAANYVETLMKDDTTGHDFFHVLRVVEIAKQLAKNQKVDVEIVLLAAYLHDIDDPKLVTPSMDSRSRYRNFLEVNHYPSERIHLIAEIISNMSYSSYVAGKRVTTLEGKIVQDADRLDAIGAIGIARAFAYGGSKRRPIFEGDLDDDSSIAHFYQKLLKLPALLHTPKAKKIASKRIRLMKQFLKGFHKEFDQGKRQ